MSVKDEPIWMARPGEDYHAHRFFLDVDGIHLSRRRPVASCGALPHPDDQPISRPRKGRWCVICKPPRAVGEAA